ncbi:hypothetical protein PtB15_4B396 [Puccinia triticina]|nr:hypothetical protein PtB15_4B396 [Puccinia triticina]
MDLCPKNTGSLNQSIRSLIGPFRVERDSISAARRPRSYRWRYQQQGPSRCGQCITIVQPEFDYGESICEYVGNTQPTWPLNGGSESTFGPIGDPGFPTYQHSPSELVFSLLKNSSISGRPS